ncbi:MAG: Spy/CpxP family protein refolding chaperone [Alphaproteobacteria bacterium]|nr:Spy/CpxP family protein refolding chaperone [Alphaproteobacteria bacterium]
MNTRSKLSIAALAAVLGLGLTVGATGPSLAQFMGPDGGHGKPQHHAGFQGQRADRIDGRLAFLKAELKITPAQESKWQDYEKVLRGQAAERKLASEKMRAEWQAKRAEFRKAADEAKAKGQPAPRPTRASVSAVERMERQQKFMKARLDNQEKVLDAFKPLYASLTDDQKKTADQLFAGGHGGRGHRMHRG